MARLRFWIVLALLCAGIVGPIVRGELSEEEKRKREAREEMRTVESPTPSASPKKKAKPKAATPKKKKKTTKATPTPEEEEETPKKAKTKETPEPEETPKHKAKSPAPKPKATPKKEKGKEEEEKEETETPTPRPKATATPERATEIPRAGVVPAPSPEQSAEVIVQKSGLQETEVLPEPTPEEHRFLFWKWSDKSGGGRYRYLSRSVRNEIDHARVLRRRWQYIVVHNSGTRQGNARIFDYYHRHVRRMTNGLAYHFVIGNGTSSDNGEIEVGDRWRRQINGGHVHSDYLNNIALGICLVGDFNRDQPTRAQLEACEELIRYLRQRCGKIEAHYAIVKPHREMNPPRWPTDCPGDAFPYSWFRRFQ